jgi:hypothetical protein
MSEVDFRTGESGPQVRGRSCTADNAGMTAGAASRAMPDQRLETQKPANPDALAHEERRLEDAESFVSPMSLFLQQCSFRGGFCSDSPRDI